MKRLVSMLLTIAMLFTLAGCELSEDIITTSTEASTTETAIPPQNNDTTERKPIRKAPSLLPLQKTRNRRILHPPQKTRNRRILHPLRYQNIRALRSTILMWVRQMPPSCFATVRLCS